MNDMKSKMISKLKQKGHHHHQEKLQGKEAKSKKPSKRQWPALRGNPRIVRVSPLFGGKDRHSKVCTIKGLRDRRIRLSVPTAIQLYDLQNKLGLSQPSKVIDWLIQVTKFDIEKLPPLPISMDFDPFYQQFLIPHNPNALQSPVFPHQPKISSFANHDSFPNLQNYGVENNCYPFEPLTVSSSSSQFGNHGLGFPFPLMDANPASSLAYPLCNSFHGDRNSSQLQSHQTQF